MVQLNQICNVFNVTSAFDILMYFNIMSIKYCYKMYFQFEIFKNIEQ